MEIVVPISTERNLFLLVIFLAPLIYSSILALAIDKIQRDKSKFILLNSIKSYSWVTLCFISAAVIVVLVIEDIEYLEDSATMGADEIIRRVRVNENMRSLTVYAFELLAILGCGIIPLIKIRKMVPES